MWVILVIILIIAVGAGAYFWWQKEKTKSNTNAAANAGTTGTQNVNTSVNASSNTLSNTNSVDTSAWTTQEDKYGFTIAIPKNWTLQRKRVTQGQYKDNLPTDQEVISPPNNTLDFPAAADCTISAYPVTHPVASIVDWINASNIYGTSGSEDLNVSTMVPQAINTRDGVLATEQGPNMTQGRSYFFQSNSNMIRFSYYYDLDVSPRGDFLAYRDTCAAVLQSIGK